MVPTSYRRASSRRSRAATSAPRAPVPRPARGVVGVVARASVVTGAAGLGDVDVTVASVPGVSVPGMVVDVALEDAAPAIDAAVLSISLGPPSAQAEATRPTRRTASTHTRKRLV